MAATQQIEATKLSQREPFIYYLVTGSLSSTGTQYTALVSTAATSTDVVVATGTYIPARSGKFQGVATGAVVECSFSVGLSGSTGGPAAELTIQARNPGSSWNTLISTAAITTTTAESIYSYSGYFATTSTFNYVPFEWQVMMRTTHASLNTIGRLTNASYIRGEFEPGT